MRLFYSDIYGIKWGSEVYFLCILVLQNAISSNMITAISFSLCLGVVFVRTDRGLLHTLSSPLAGGMMARRLLPWTIGLPLLLHGLILAGEQQNWYDRTASTAFQTLFTVLMLSGLTWWTARSLDRADHRRQQAEDSLRQVKTSLANQIADRSDRAAEPCTLTDRLQPELQDQQQIEQTWSDGQVCDSEASFQTLIQDLNVGVLLQDANAKILLSNPKATELMGLTEDQLLGKVPLALDGRVIREDGSLFPSNVQPASLAIATRRPIRNVVMGVYRQPADLHLREQAGQPVWLLADAEPQITPSGEICHVLCTFSDITQRKRLLELKTAQAQKEKALNQVMQTIRHSLDLETVFTTATAAIAQLLQADRAAIVQYLPEQALWRNVADHHRMNLPSVLGKSVLDSAHFASDQLKQFQVVQFDGASPIPSETKLALVPEQAGAAAWLVVPLPVNGLLWGSLDLTRNGDRPDWQDSEVDLALAIADQLAIGIQQSELYQKLQAANQKLQRLATLDGLTQIPNRRRFDDYLRQEALRMAREQAPLSLILCDVDFFKPYNDTYGHLAGDACLIQVAQAISCAIKRPADLAARYGGEEFAVILPNTDSKGAMQVAQDIREAIQQLHLPHAASSVSEQVTLSLGIASILTGCPYSVKLLIDTADQALYQAKKEGRDRVQLREIDSALKVSQNWGS